MGYRGRLEGFGSWFGGRQWALILALVRFWRTKRGLVTGFGWKGWDTDIWIKDGSITLSSADKAEIDARTASPFTTGTNKLSQDVGSQLKSGMTVLRINGEDVATGDINVWTELQAADAGDEVEFSIVFAVYRYKYI